MIGGMLSFVSPTMVNIKQLGYVRGLRSCANMHVIDLPVSRHTNHIAFGLESSLCAQCFPYSIFRQCYLASCLNLLPQLAIAATHQHFEASRKSFESGRSWKRTTCDRSSLRSNYHGHRGNACVDTVGEWSKWISSR